LGPKAFVAVAWATTIPRRILSPAVTLVVLADGESGKETLARRI
jgi:hypothetical protein